MNFNKNWYKKNKLAILKQNNIDPILSLYNMVIAPNLRQHTDSNLEAVVIALKEADKNELTREAIIKTLYEQGKIAKEVYHDS